MPLRVVKLGEIAEFCCAGDCDLESAPEVEDAIARSARQGFRLFLIDLTQTRYLDSRGIRMLLRARGEAEALAGRMVVVGLQWQPRRALDIVGLRQVLRCVATRDEALAYLLGQENDDD